MEICLLSSVLAFIAGFLSALACLTKCSKEKWDRVKRAIDEAREADNGNQD